jgi:ribonucleoside-diphosphate reductase alpha chain
MDKSIKILSDLVVWMKYAKYIPEKQRREIWSEIVDRNKEMHLKKFPELAEKIEDAYELVYNKKVLPSMRSMQFAGKPIEINPARMYNCSYQPIDDYRAFSEGMFLLLSGVGYGYSVQLHHVEKLPEIKKPTKERRYLIGDSIEGWSDAVKTLMKSYLLGTSRPNFDFSDIRQKGMRLITSGGKAPGPEPLKKCLFEIQLILDRKEQGSKLTPLDCHDIMCHIADAVLAGGIRRSAMISLFSFDDEEMLTCKYGTWWELNPQRGRANNSAVVLSTRINEEEFWDIWKKIEYSNAGEPGLYFTNDVEYGTNPCISGDSLITVRDHGFNGGIGSIYKIPMKVLYELSKTSYLLPCALSVNPSTNKFEWKQITAAMLTKRSTSVVRIKYKDKILKCTPDHRIFTKNRGWVEAKDLATDDVLLEEEFY